MDRHHRLGRDRRDHHRRVDDRVEPRPRITGYGFVVFTVGSLAWLGDRPDDRPAGALWTNVVLTVLNLFGIWRWLGRRRRIEEGGNAAAEASEAGAGRDPVSGVAADQGADRGWRRAECSARCVDAMAGCRAAAPLCRRFAKAALPGSGRRFAACRGAAPAVEGRQARDALIDRLRRARGRLNKDQWPVPLIVTAELAPQDFAWLDDLRRRHYPARAQPAAGASHHVPRACRRRPRPSCASALRAMPRRARRRAL